MKGSLQIKQGAQEESVLQCHVAVAAGKALSLTVLVFVVRKKALHLATDVWKGC